MVSVGGWFFGLVWCLVSAELNVQEGSASLTDSKAGSQGSENKAEFVVGKTPSRRTGTMRHSCRFGQNRTVKQKGEEQTDKKQEPRPGAMITVC